MKPEIIFRKIRKQPLNLEGQRAIARSILVQATGKNLEHSHTGRPIVDNSMDVSISHREDMVCVGIVPKPYRIGIDVESIDVELNPELFFGPVITKAEQTCLKTFCENNNLSLASGVAIFWSIKEAFFKCLDYDLKPGKVNIISIARDGRAIINCEDEIKQFMVDRRLKFHSAKTSFFDKKLSFNKVIMKEGVGGSYPPN